MDSADIEFTQPMKTLVIMVGLFGLIGAGGAFYWVWNFAAPQASELVSSAKAIAEDPAAQLADKAREFSQHATDLAGEQATEVLTGIREKAEQVGTETAEKLKADYLNQDQLLEQKEKATALLEAKLEKIKGALSGAATDESLTESQRATESAEESTN